MQDRVPLYPGRVTLIPVQGLANTYTMTRADQPTREGTPLNKASLLRDETAALYGLNDQATPDDILQTNKTEHNSLDRLARSALGASGGASLVLTPSGRLTAGGEEDGIAMPESELTLDLSSLPEGAKISYFSFEAVESGSSSSGRNTTYLVSFGLKINGDKYTIGQKSFTQNGNLSNLLNAGINSQTLFGVSPSKSDTVSLFLESEITSVGSGHTYIMYTITVSLRYLPG